jgi:hypothetical protein
MVEYGLAELKAWRRNDRTTCAILKHDGEPYVILRYASKIVAIDEAAHVWKTDIADGLTALADDPPATPHTLNDKEFTRRWFGNGHRTDSRAAGAEENVATASQRLERASNQ